VKPKKQPTAVELAEELVRVKTEERDAAKAVVARLEADVGAAYAALRAAQIEADSALPQCDLVSTSRNTGKETGRQRVVILRKTPTGLLVVRTAGMPGGGEYQFEWSKYTGTFSPKKRAKHYTSESRKLSDVPPEYMPAKEAA
jgi:hypothetical protein